MKPCVLITGQIRDEAVLEGSLHQYRMLKNAGLIDRVYLSIWHGQLPENSRIRERLKLLDGVLIESPEPAEFTTFHFFYHQVKSARLALDRLPDRQRVMRTRADVLFQNHEDIARLLTCDLSIGGGSPISGPFTERVWAPFFNIETPFLISDIVLVGRAGDLRQMFIPDASPELWGTGCWINGERNHQLFAASGPELRLFLPPFERIFPVLRTFRESFIHHTGSKEFVEFSLGSEWYWRYLSLYYFILLSYFRIGGDVIQDPVYSICRIDQKQGNGPAPTRIFPRTTVDHNLFSANWLGQSKRLFADSSEWLRRVFRGEIEDPAINRLLHPALTRAITFNEDMDWQAYEVYRAELAKRLTEYYAKQNAVA